MVANVHRPDCAGYGVGVTTSSSAPSTRCAWWLDPDKLVSYKLTPGDVECRDPRAEHPGARWARAGRAASRRQASSTPFIHGRAT